MKKGFLLAVTLFTFLFSFAQQKFTLSGTVRDQKTGETLIGATIVLSGNGTYSVVSNGYGFYSITAPKNDYQLSAGFSGYQLDTATISLSQNVIKNIDLTPQATQLKEIVISAKQQNDITKTLPGMQRISMNEIKNVPVIFGEKDILKTIQLLPGIKTAGEGSSGFFVRGGGADQNLILLDEATVYNASHLLGFFSTFNSDAIKDVTIYKGDMPAQYGGRLSSLLDIKMKDGNDKNYKVSGGIGLISSRINVEGPIVKNKGSFMISARRTYADLFLKLSHDSDVNQSIIYFYDLNAKANYQINQNNRVYLSGYFGKDVFNFKSSSGDFGVKMPWGNTTATVRWNHQFSPKLFLNTTAVYNDYKFEFKSMQNDMNIKFNSGIKDWNGKFDFDYYPSVKHHVKFGGNYTNHTFTPNQTSGKAGETEFAPDNSLIKFAHETGIYILDEYDLSSRIKINGGIRYSWFGQIGPYTKYGLDLNGNKLDSTAFASGKLVEDYGGWEPRVNVRYKINENSSLKASVAKTYQYIHLVTNNGSTLPTDIWMPSTAIVKPQKAWQYAAGYFQNFFNDALETSVEVYYKEMKNQIEYRAGYTPTSLRDPELDFVFGDGNAYGAEFFINKTKGKFTGWIGYTLSWTWRNFASLNNGEKFPAKYDRRHDLSIVTSYEFSKKLNASAIFIFGTGNAITLPTGYYIIDGNVIQDNSKLNAYRLMPYHRLDLSLVYTPKPNSTKRWQGSWAFSVYNVYSRQNPYLLYVETTGNVQSGTEVKVKQVSIFPILPSITYNFKF